MANEEHLRILLSGVDAWNQWRHEHAMQPIDLTNAELANANLFGAWLQGANLSRANLHRADLRYVNFLNANLRHANLTATNVQYANLRPSILSDANLSDADLEGANVGPFVADNLDLSHAIMSRCQLSELSLQSIKGLDTVLHIAPSSIGVDVLARTAADLNGDATGLPIIEKFLEGAGVPREYIELFRWRIGQPIQYYSCFISYSTKDQEFADKLNADLRHRNVRCWLASEDLKIGDKFRLKINEQIRRHDKLILVLSEQSIESSWVEYEVKQAFEREKAEGKDVLFPIRIDDAVMETPEAWAAQVRKQCHIGDFRKWKDHDEYQRALARLIRDLQADDKTRPASI